MDTTTAVAEGENMALSIPIKPEFKPGHDTEQAVWTQLSDELFEYELEPIQCKFVTV